MPQSGGLVARYARVSSDRPLQKPALSHFALPIGMLTALQTTRRLVPTDIWLAIVLGHALRCALSVWRFEQGKCETIEVKLA